MRFTATEAGCARGVGGASNKRGTGDAHYIVFGLQTDKQHPTNRGIYFEWDHEDNGALDCVRSVSVTREQVVFRLAARKTIVVDSGVSARDWTRFLAGIEKIFGAKLDGVPRRKR